MGKKKNKPVADHVREKRKGAVKKTNPFEVKINRSKHDVLGRKVTKFEKGMPGVSRSKANKKRKNTLLKEYEQQFKSNKFVDKRFGEHDTTMSLEDKMMKRFALERARTSTKNKFSLNDEEELTHYGQSLADIEKFDDPIISDEDEADDDEKRAAAKLVATEHFGGFMQKRDPVDEKKSWKERMEEMIADTKKKRYEKQKEKEQTQQMTEDLDQQWKSLHNLLSEAKLRGKAPDDKPKVDDYDIAVRSLAFEIKGQATDRLKTEEELAKEEKDKLEKLEADRRRRMQGITEEEEAAMRPAHRSADDLDDGFGLEPRLDFDYVSYKDGKLLQEIGNQKQESLEKIDSDDDEDDDEGSDDDNSDDDGEEMEGEDDDDDDESSDNDDYTCADDNVNHTKTTKKADQSIHSTKNTLSDCDQVASGKSKDKRKAKSVTTDSSAKKSSKDSHQLDDNSDDDSDDENDADEESDDYEDIQSDNDAGDDDGDDDDKLTKKKSLKNITFDKTAMIEQAQKELPYTFDAPASYDALLDLLEDHDLENQLTIIERIRKCHHPSLAEGNKQKLERLFEQLVQFYCDLCIQDPPQLDFANRLVSHLYGLTQMFPEHAADVVTAIMAERQQEFALICQRKAGRGLYPGLDTMLLFKLVSILFPTSDFRHQVTTSAMIFMGQILGQTPVNHGRDVVAGLFMCTLCLEYIALSKRYIPEVISLLQGLLFYASNKEQGKIEQVMPPFKPVGAAINLLHITSPVKKLSEEKWSMSEMLAPVVEESLYQSDQFKVKCIHMTVSLLQGYSQLYSELVTFKEVFAPMRCMLDKLPTDNYPDTLQTKISEVITYLEEKSSSKRHPMAMQKRKPKPLKMFEPKIEEKFDGRKKGKRGTRDFNEKQKLLHKHKTAMRGAVRELRKDTRFLARERISEQMKKDEARKRKVREIMGGLAHQEGEYKKLKLGKKDDDGPEKQGVKR